MYPFEDTNYEIRTEIGILQGKIFKTFLNIMTGFFFLLFCTESYKTTDENWSNINVSLVEKQEGDFFHSAIKQSSFDMESFQQDVKSPPYQKLNQCYSDPSITSSG